MQGWQRDSDPHSEFLGPRWVGASVNHGAFFLKLRLKPLPFALAVGLRIRYLSDLRVSQVPGGDQMDRSLAIHRSCMRLVGLPPGRHYQPCLLFIDGSEKVGALGHTSA